jgi:hypothetical protein
MGSATIYDRKPKKTRVDTIFCKRFQAVELLPVVVDCLLILFYNKIIRQTRPSFRIRIEG